MRNRFVYSIRRKMQILFFNCFSKEKVSKTYFKIVLKYKLDLDNPKTFNEKIQWLKLYEWPNNELVINCTDKYKVRDFLKSKHLEKYLNTLIGAYNRAEDIDWDKLPNQFVLKCNHGCAYNIICKDKTTLDVKKTIKTLNKWLKEDFGKFNAEIHYSKIRPKIICEKYLGDNLEDYKFFCFNGKFKFMYVAIDSDDSNKEREAFFDENGELINVTNADYGLYKEAVVPDNFKELVQISETLSTDFPFVRVDWYIKDGIVTFGELTFTPSGGMMRFNPSSFDGIAGDMLDISSLMEKHNGK